MRGGKKAYIKAIALAKQLRFCFGCHVEGHIGKSGLDSYFCSYCYRTSVIGKDNLIITWYVIRKGRRVLESYEVPADAPYWMAVIRTMEKNKKIKRGSIHG